MVKNPINVVYERSLIKKNLIQKVRGNIPPRTVALAVKKLETLFVELWNELTYFNARAEEL